VIYLRSVIIDDRHAALLRDKSRQPLSHSLGERDTSVEVSVNEELPALGRGSGEVPIGNDGMYARFRITVDSSRKLRFEPASQRSFDFLWRHGAFSKRASGRYDGGSRLTSFSMKLRITSMNSKQKAACSST